MSLRSSSTATAMMRKIKIHRTFVTTAATTTNNRILTRVTKGMSTKSNSTAKANNIIDTRRQQYYWNTKNDSMRLYSHNSVSSSNTMTSLYNKNHWTREFTAEATATKEEENKNQEQKEQQKDDDDDECPAWQNPIIHEKNKDPKNRRVLISEFEADGEEAPIIPLPPFQSQEDFDAGKVNAPPHVHDIADEILTMSMMEVKELVDRIADHFDFQSDDQFDPSQQGEAEEQEEEVKEEKTAFDLKLLGFDAKSKIKIIKEVRSITALGLKEAKALVEGAPKVIMSDMKKEECEELMKKFHDLGAQVEMV